MWGVASESIIHSSVLPVCPATHAIAVSPCNYTVSGFDMMGRCCLSMVVFSSLFHLGGSLSDFTVNRFVSFSCAVVARDVARV